MRSLPTVAGGPQVRLLDAGERGIETEAGLREAARRGSAAAGAAHSSRSYCFPYALLASHETPVGVDLERIGPCDEAFARSILTPREAIDYASVEDPDTRFTSIWSSKEALAKALGDALAYDPRRLESPAGWPEGRAGSWRALALPVPAGHVGWVCWRAS